jgi:hypothetical protein
MERESGKAADTGTAIGLMVELWHRGDDPDRAITRTENAATGGFADRHPFSLADLGEATRAFRRYAADPRNDRGMVLVDSLEREVSLELPPHPFDPTGAPVCISGHLDQVRIGAHGMLEVWDVKHSRFNGDDLLKKYFWQQAAYTIATGASYGRPVKWGGLICTKGYLVRGAQTRAPDAFRVHFRASMTVADCKAALDAIRFTVAMIRRGAIAPTPGVFCNYCPAKTFAACRHEMSGIFEG